MSKNKKAREGIVYSTDPNFSYRHTEEREAFTLPPNQQRLRVELDKRARKGKAVTLVSGFIGSASDLETLGKQLKNLCGVGGSAKDGEIILQGDHRTKVIERLFAEGYTGTKKVGG